MTDATVASIGRNLAAALMHYAHERDEQSKKDIQRLHTELCAAVRNEQRETIIGDAP